MHDPSTQEIPLAVRLAMGRAAVQVVADDIGVRLLHIKGDTVHPSLRPVASSGSDVDVLFDAAQTRRMHAALLRAGWRVYSTYQGGSPFGHAQTYFHDDWGHLDLHRRFPGIQVSDTAAFDRLWADRIDGTAAGIRYAAPSVDAQLVLLMLNAARDIGGGRVAADALWAPVDAEQRIRCLALVAELDAVVAFAAAAGRLDSYAHRREYLLWKSVSQGGSRVGEWWGRIRAQRSLRDAIAVGLRAPLVNREQLEHRLGRPAQTTDVIAEFLARTGHGISEAFMLITRRSR